MVQTISQESYSDCTQEKKKQRSVQYLNYSNCVSFSSWDQVQIVSNWEQSMLYTKSLQVLGISMLTGVKVSSLTHVNVYFTDQNLMRRQEPMELNFAGLETYQWIELKEYKKKWGRLTSYHVYSHAFGL